MAKKESSFDNPLALVASNFQKVQKALSLNSQNIKIYRVENRDLDNGSPTYVIYENNSLPEFNGVGILKGAAILD